MLHYSEPNFPKLTSIFIVIGFFAAFGIIALIPVDIASVVITRDIEGNDQEVIDSYNKNWHYLGLIYNVFFITILVLGNTVQLFLEYYDTDGKKRNCL